MFNVAENIYWLPTQNVSQRPDIVMIYCVSALKIYLLYHISYHSKSPLFNGAEGIYWLPFYVCLGSNGPMISLYSCLTCGFLVIRNLPHECQPIELIWNQMAAILQIHFQLHYLDWKCVYYQIFITEMCSQGPFYHIVALVEIMAWRQTGDRPFSEPIMVHFTAAYMSLRLDEQSVFSPPGIQEWLHHNSTNLSFWFLLIWYRGYPAQCKFNLPDVVLKCISQ